MGKHQLNQSQADEIRRLFAEEGIGVKELSRMFRVSHTQIARVLREENWKREKDIYREDTDEWQED